MDTLAQWEEADDAQIVNTVLENSEALCVPEPSLHYYLPQSQANVNSILTHLEADGKIVRWGQSGRSPLVSDAARTANTKEKIIEALTAFHSAEPLLAGSKTRHNCAENSNWTRSVLRNSKNRLMAEGHLAKEGNLLRLASHEIQFSEEEATAKERLEQLFLEAGLNTPTFNALSTHLPDYTPQLLESTFFALLNLGQFVKIADTFFIHRTVFEEIRELLMTYLRGK